MQKLITKKEAAELLGVSPSTFDRARKRLGFQHVHSVVRVKPLLFRSSDVAMLLMESPRLTRHLNRQANASRRRGKVLVSLSRLERVRLSSKKRAL